MSVILLLAASAISAGTGTTWDWSGTLRPGAEVRIQGITGNIHALPSDTGEVRISAAIQDDSTVEMRVTQARDGIAVCAARRVSEVCSTDPLTGPSVRIDYEVRLPKGARLVARTVNGEIAAESLTGDVDASTVNGGVSITTSGTAQARTVNGSIRANLLKPFWDKAPEFSAVNGGISVHVPGNARAGVRAETRNGKIVSDVQGFRGTATEQTLDGAIGRASGAGNPLVIRTINGTIELHQRF